MENAMNILLEGKTDTELLEALVAALVNNNEHALNSWAKYEKEITKNGANIEVVRHICRNVIERNQATDDGELTPGEEAIVTE